MPSPLTRFYSLFPPVYGTAAYARQIANLREAENEKKRKENQAAPTGLRHCFPPRLAG